MLSSLPRDAPDQGPVMAATHSGMFVFPDSCQQLPGSVCVRAGEFLEERDWGHFSQRFSCLESSDVHPEGKIGQLRLVPVWEQDGANSSFQDCGLHSFVLTLPHFMSLRKELFCPLQCPEGPWPPLAAMAGGPSGRGCPTLLFLLRTFAPTPSPWPLQGGPCQLRNPKACPNTRTRTEGSSLPTPAGNCQLLNGWGFF